jgi:hypothetical protein
MDRSAFRPFTDFTTHRTSGVSSDGLPALSPVTRPSILRNAPSKDVTHSPRPTHSRVMFTTPNIASNDAYAIPRIDDVSLVPPGKLRRAADSRASATSAAAPATHALDSLWSVNPELRVRYHGRHPARSIATGADNSSRSAARRPYQPRVQRGSEPSAHSLVVGEERVTQERAQGLERETRGCTRERRRGIGPVA